VVVDLVDIIDVVDTEVVVGLATGTAVVDLVSAVEEIDTELTMVGLATAGALREGLATNHQK